MCGEKIFATFRGWKNGGSPPRVRGKVIRSWIMRIWTRITPACAGKRAIWYLSIWMKWDHPRVCGEKSVRLSAVWCTPGSPPRVRGKVPLDTVRLLWYRITPACAGKRRAPTNNRLRMRDHPRVCGEKPNDAARLSRFTGSPPRVRGKEPTGQLVGQMIRITPACAGKRLKRSHSIGHFSCILCLFHSVLHRASVSGGSRAGPCAPPCLPAQNAVPV